MSSARYRGESREQRYRGNTGGQDESRQQRDARRGDNSPGYAGQNRQRWNTEPSERSRGGYGSQGPPYAEPQGDGDPFGNDSQDWQPSGGPARWSEEDDRSSSAGRRFTGGSRSFDGYDRGGQGRNRSGGGYGEYNYRDEGSPRGRSTRGDYSLGDTRPYPQGSFFGSSGFQGQQQGYGSFGERSRGQFSGKGPKGYQRSDDRVREDVSDAFERNGELDASEIEVQVQRGGVTLEGTVHDRSSKRLAEDVIENISGVKQVHNRLRVGNTAASEKPKEPGSRDSPGKGSGSHRSA